MDHLNEKFKQTTFFHGDLELCQPFLSFKVYSFVDWIRRQVVFYYSIEYFEQVEFVLLSIESLHHVLDKLFHNTILIVFIGFIKHKAYFSGQVSYLIVCAESLEKVKKAFSENFKIDIASTGFFHHLFIPVFIILFDFYIQSFFNFFSISLLHRWFVLNFLESFFQYIFKISKIDELGLLATNLS